jgi:hypothetical protein
MLTIEGTTELLVNTIYQDLKRGMPFVLKNFQRTRELRLLKTHLDRIYTFFFLGTFGISFLKSISVPSDLMRVVRRHLNCKQSD